MSNKRAVALGLGAVVMLLVAALAWDGVIRLVKGRVNWQAAERAERMMMLTAVANSICRYQQLHSGQIPSSIAEAIEADPENWRDNASREPFLETDRTKHRVLERAVLLQDMPNPRGGSFRWALAVVIPRDRKLLSAFREDYVYGVVSYDSRWWSSLETAEAAKRVFGQEVVDAAYRRQREDQARRAASGSP